MSEMNVRSDAVDVEQIMRQIRARIREKRGADYTEAELQQLAIVKLEKFLDPKGLRSNLVAEYRRTRVVPPPPPSFEFNHEFGEDTLYATHRGLLRGIRRLLNPLLKLFINPGKITWAFHVITSALHTQAGINSQAEGRLRRLEEREPLSYELLHNLTLEITRLGIEVHNLKMRVESLSSRLDFDERRAKSLEGVVQYRPPQPQRPAPPQTPALDAAAASAPAGVTALPGPGAATGAGAATGPAAPQGGPNGTREGRRRRRRRRRRPGGTMADGQGQTWSRGQAGPAGPAGADAGETQGPDDGSDDDAGDAGTDAPDRDSTDQ